MMPVVYQTVVDPVISEPVIESSSIVIEKNEIKENKSSHIPHAAAFQGHLIESEKEEEEDDSLT